ncbi:MAG TPA: hypothetical protein VGG99_26925 [Acetobacteraceae bacterium]|jgi:hypothetical protein
MNGPAFVRVLGCLLLAGCALVDQNTFAPAPEARAQSAAPAPPVAVRVDSRTPLVTIDFGGPLPDYTGLLRYAVHEAQNRDRDVQFDVVVMLPDATQAPRGQDDALGVMRTMMQSGVAASHIHLGLQADPTLKSREVRVYVR